MSSTISNDILTELATNAACPRCGYGLRGIVESWSDACPLTGVCSECGLKIKWKELLNPRRAVPRWSVEYAQWWGIPIAAIKTLLVMFFRPRKFWCDLKMIHEPRWGRIPACVFLTLAVLYLAFAVHVGFAIHHAYKVATIVLPPMTIRDPFVMGLYAAMNPFSTYSATVPSGTGTRGTSPTAREYAWGTWNSPSPRTYAFKCQPIRILRNIWAAVRNKQFANPWNLDDWESSNPLATPWYLDVWVSKRTSVLLAHCVMIAFLSPVVFLVLPRSLRRAKVRYRHLVRIGLYSLFFFVIPILLIMHHQIMGNWTTLRSDALNSFIAFFLPVICLVIWWSLAAKHYLKLPHAWGVGVSMVVLAYAGGLILVSLIGFVLF